MVEKEQRENNREGDPNPQLLVEGQVGEDAQEKKTRDCDQHRGGVIDVDCADKIALLPFEHQPAVPTGGMHSEHRRIQRSDTAARTLEAQAISEHR